MLEVAVEFGLNFIWGVIPDNKDPDLIFAENNIKELKLFCEALTANNQTVALHGYQHLITEENGKRGEFFGLSYAQEYDLIHKAKLLLENYVGQTIYHYMPPAHGTTVNTHKILNHLNIKYLCDGYYPCLVKISHLIFIPQTCWFPKLVPGVLMGSCLHLEEQNNSEELIKWVRKNHQNVEDHSDSKVFPINTFHSIYSFVWQGLLKIRQFMR